MELLTFDKVVTNDDVQGWTGLTVDEWYKGKGIYQVDVGSRGEIENVVFYGNVTGLYVKNVDELIDDLRIQMSEESQEDIDEEVKYLEEMAGISVDESGIVEFVLNEEQSEIYFKVE